MLSMFKDCPKKYYYASVLGYRAKGVSPALAWGTAFHTAIEIYQREITNGRSIEDSLRPAIRAAFCATVGGSLGDDNSRTRLTLLRALVWYSDQYSHDPIRTLVLPSGPALELSFRFQLPVPGLPETVYYAGHIDRIGSYAGGHYVIDYKSTTSTLGAGYFSRYEYSAQIGGYLAAGKIVFETPIHGAMVDSVQTGVNFARFGRKIFSRASDHLEEWIEDTQWWIREIYRASAEGVFAHNQEACNKYGGCQFREVCFKSPSFRPRVLAEDFRIDRWDPTISRGE